MQWDPRASPTGCTKPRGEVSAAASVGDVPWECPDLGRQTLARGSQESLHHPTTSPFLLMNPTAPVFNLSLLTALPKPAFVQSAHHAVFAADRAEGAACQQSPNFFFIFFFPYKTSPCQDLGTCLCVMCAGLRFYCASRGKY